MISHNHTTLYTLDRITFNSIIIEAIIHTKSIIDTTINNI
jgi:hypothetical protein